MFQDEDRCSPGRTCTRPSVASPQTIIWVACSVQKSQDFKGLVCVAGSWWSTERCSKLCAARNVFQVLLFLLANINSSGAQLRRCGDYLLYPNSFETSKIPNYQDSLTGKETKRNTRSCFSLCIPSFAASYWSWISARIGLSYTGSLNEQGRGRKCARKKRNGFLENCTC